MLVIDCLALMNDKPQRVLPNVAKKWQFSINWACKKDGNVYQGGQDYKLPAKVYPDQLTEFVQNEITSLAHMGEFYKIQLMVKGVK